MMTGEASAEAELGPAMGRVARQWSKGNTGARMYDFIVMHEGLSNLLAKIMWAGSWSDLYSDIASLGGVPAGTRILDVPCGGGIAFRGLDPNRPVQYVACDISPFMLKRAWVEAARRGLAGVEAAERGVAEIEFLHADVTHIPYDDATFDLCLSYNGLHCFPYPELALTEMARVLRPGGELRGTAIVAGGGWMSAACIGIFQRASQFAAVSRTKDIRRWLAAAGFSEVQARQWGANVVFNGKKAAP
jgi:SAM-dependent methyltransferase